MREGEMCEACGKWLFRTYSDADHAAKRARFRGERVVAYKCPFNKRGYHAGHGLKNSRKERVRG